MANQETLKKRNLRCSKCNNLTYKYFKIMEKYYPDEQNKYIVKKRIVEKLCKQCFKEW